MYAVDQTLPFFAEVGLACETTTDATFCASFTGGVASQVQEAIFFGS